MDGEGSVMFQKYRKLRGSLTSCFLRILRRWIGRTSRSSCGRVGSRQPAIRTLGLEYLLPSTATKGCVHSRVVLVSSAGLLSVRRRVRAGNPEARQLTGWRRARARPSAHEFWFPPELWFPPYAESSLDLFPGRSGVQQWVGGRVDVGTDRKSVV